MGAENRFISFLRERDWPGMLFELLTVAIGVMLGIGASDWTSKRQEQRRVAQIAAVVRQDLRDGFQVEQKAAAEIDAGLSNFEQARKRGERPPPYIFRIPGSDTPPNTIWQATFQTGLADLIDPGLLFDLGFFYSEREGIGSRYSHYARSVEDQILPKINDPTQFYDARGALKPEFAANMDRLREWRSYLSVTIRTAQMPRCTICPPRRLGTLLPRQLWAALCSRHLVIVPVMRMSADASIGQASLSDW